MRDPLAFALGQLDRLMNFFPRNDGKATFLFALDVAMAGILALNFPYQNPKSAAAGFAGGTLILIGLSLWFLYRVFFPDLKPAKTHSMVYFADIARGTSAEYGARLKAATEDELLDDLACQIHRNAEILFDKFTRIQLASTFTAIAVLPWLTFLVVLAMQGQAVKISGG